MTFFVPGIVLSCSRNSLATWISVGRLLASSEMILSQIALDDGGPQAMTLLVTLSHFTSSFCRDESQIFSRSNTLFSPRDARISFFVNSTDISTWFPDTDVDT